MSELTTDLSKLDKKKSELTSLVGNVVACKEILMKEQEELGKEILTLTDDRIKHEKVPC